MSTNHVNLDPATVAHAQKLATEMAIPVEAVIARAVEQFEPSRSVPLTQGQQLGSFADVADILDEVVEEAYSNRERTPLRLDSE